MPSPSVDCLGIFVYLCVNDSIEFDSKEYCSLRGLNLEVKYIIGKMQKKIKIEKIGDQLTLLPHLCLIQ